MEYIFDVLRVIVLVAVLVGILNYKYANRFFKILSIQVFVYAVLVIGLLIQKHYHLYTKTPYSNIYYYYLHVGVEAYILYFAAYSIMKTRIEKRIFYFLLSCFTLVFLYHAVYLGLDTVNDLADIVACISMTTIYAIVLNRFIIANKNKWWKSPEILTTISLVTYFACSVPYISLTVYLKKNEQDVAEIFSFFINFFLANLRYLLLLISLIIIYLSKGKNQLVLEDSTFEDSGIRMS